MPTPPPRQSIAALHPAKTSARGDVSLFIGCLGSHYVADTATAAIALLTRLGWNVRVPPAQACCGALHAHGGDARGAKQLGAVNRAAFGDDDASVVLTLASGCHESLQLSLSGDEEVVVRDALDFIVADAQFGALRFRRWRGDAPVAVHLPCTQRNVTRTATRVVPALTAIPGIELAALPETGCCGAAGSHMLIFPERADALRAPLLDSLASTRATTLCSANVGCRLHLQAGLEQRGANVTLQHPLCVLAEYLV
jgi:glycolate oxidase iron-sulfur subunit